MIIERDDQGPIRVDQGAYLGQDGLVGVGLAVGDHGPVQGQEHCVDQPGGSEAFEQPVGQFGVGVGRDRTCLGGPGHERRQGLEAEPLRPFQKAADLMIRLAPAPLNARAFFQPSRPECREVDPRVGESV